MMPFLMDFTSLQHAGPMIEGGDPVTGHIISTTIGGKNGEPKRVIFSKPRSCRALLNSMHTVISFLTWVVCFCAS
jgi:hypothetical protein